MTEEEGVQKEEEAQFDQDEYAKSLGYSSWDDLDKKVSNLNKWEKEVQAEAMANAQYRKNLTEMQQAEATPSERPSRVADIDPEVRQTLEEVFDEFAAQKLGPVLNEATVSIEDQAAMMLDNFFGSHPDMDRDEFIHVMDTEELWPQQRSLRQLSKALDRGVRLMESQKEVDIEGIKQEAKEEVIKELKAKGVEVVDIKPKKGSESESPKEEPATWVERMKQALDESG